MQVVEFIKQTWSAISRSILFCLIGCVSLCVGPVSGQTVVWLGTFGGTQSQAYDVSADGQVVVGWAYDAVGNRRAFRWTTATGMQDLGTLGGLQSQANAVSADGQVVVGEAYNASGDRRAFRWTPSSGMQDLGEGIAYDVSADGQVVVGWMWFMGAQQAFRWTSTSGVQFLSGLPNGGVTIAYGVSPDGQWVVGVAYDENGEERAVRWSTSGAILDIGTLGGTWAEATDVADDATVVGRATLTTGYYRAFRWQSQSGMVDLGVLTGTFLSRAYAVSQDGQTVVGTSFGGPFYAFRWTPADGMENLNDVYSGVLGNSVLAEALGLSDDGQYIVGWGHQSGVGVRAFLLQPSAGLVVNATGDLPDQQIGDGQCSTGQTVMINGMAVPECTLRAALQEANAQSGSDEITFDIPTSDPNYDPITQVWTISPTSPLPVVTDAVIIDALTQPGAQANSIAADDTTKGHLNADLKIVLSGVQAGSASGLVLQSHNQSEIRGLVINGFLQDGIRIEGGGAHRILGNYIGTNAAGTARQPNHAGGIRISNSTANWVGGYLPHERNLISGNGVANQGGGVRIENGATQNIVVHNLIGTDAMGQSSLYNSAYGVLLTDDGTVENIVANNLIAGNEDPDFNSTDCAGAGVKMANGASGNGLYRNYIGTNTAGTGAVPNTEGVCVTLAGNANWIEGNIISGNAGRGIWITGQSAMPNRESRSTLIDSNFIGVARTTNLLGLAWHPLSNNQEGIALSSGPMSQITDNLIGGNGSHGIYGQSQIEDVAIEGNEIVGNGGWGVYLNNLRRVTIRRNGIGDQKPTNSSWQGAGGTLTGPPQPVNINWQAILSNQLGGLKLEGVRKATVGGNDYLADGNNIMAALPQINAVQLMTADSNTFRRNVFAGFGQGQYGVLVHNSSDNTFEEDAAFAFDTGIFVSAEDGQQARRNRITKCVFFDMCVPLLSCFGIGLDGGQIFGPDPTNDSGDADSGPNNLQNAPQVVAYIDPTGQLVLITKVDSDTMYARYPLQIEVFGSMAGLNDPTTRYLESFEYPATAARTHLRVELGNAVALGIQKYDELAFTATDADGNTSEFSLTMVDSVDVVGGLDFGDAPQVSAGQLPVPFGYPTQIDKDGARHGGIYHIRLGSALDVEGNGQSSPMADGDDLSGNDDEEGIRFHAPVFSPYAYATTQPLPILSPGPQSLNAQASVGGYLNAWIDFNRDGDWDDPFEHVIIERFISPLPLNSVVSFMVPSDIEEGLSVMRVRFCTKAGAGATVTGMAPDGEVEDYLVELRNTTSMPMIDFGDAPDDSEMYTYPTLLDNAAYPAAGHILGNMWLGDAIDAEGNGQPDSLALGDGADDDGVSLPAIVMPGQEVVLQVTTAGEMGYFNMWVDFNRDGDWEDTLEHVIIDTLLEGGLSHVLQFNVPDSAALGRTYVRCRLSATDSISFWGIVPNGEVEDYAIDIQEATAVSPDPSSTRLSWQIVPNPSDGYTVIHYELRQRSYVRLRICDAWGRVLATLVNSSQTAGKYKVAFDGSHLPEGLYWCVWQIDDVRFVGKVLLMR